MRKRIGITEAGDAGIDLSWYEKITTSDDFVGSILITKAIANKSFQDKVLELIKVKPTIVHACITGWGGSAMEPNVKTPEESIDAIRAFIDAGFPAKNMVLRIDPIIPNEEGLQRASHVVELAKEIIPDVKRIRISIYDDYYNARQEIVKRGYKPIDDYSARKTEAKRRPTEEQITLVAHTLMGVADWFHVFEACAEPELTKAFPDHFQWSGCVSQKDCDIMGIEVPQDTCINGQNRFGCKCLCMKTELLNNKKRCPHNCAYCYWGRN